MKAFSYFMMGLSLVACSKPKQLGGVNVGNGRQSTMATYASSLGFRFQYGKTLRLTVSVDEKEIVVDNSPLLMKGVQPSQARLQVLENRVDQRLLDESESLRSNMPALRAETERNFPGIELNEFSRPGALGFIGKDWSTGKERLIYVMATVNYDIVLAQIDVSPLQPGGEDLSSVARTLVGTRRDVQVTGIRLEGGQRRSYTDDLHVLVNISETGHESDGDLLACFAFELSKKFDSKAPVEICSYLSKMQGAYEAFLSVDAIIEGYQAPAAYSLVRLTISGADQTELARLTAPPGLEGSVLASFGTMIGWSYFNLIGSFYFDVH